MTREETLDYLVEKRQQTAGVADAEYQVSQANSQVVYQNGRLKKTIIFLAVFGVIGFMAGQPMTGFIWLAAAVGVFFYKKTKWVQPATEVLTAARQRLDQERQNPNYINGAQGFPSEFYNYSEVYRLWKLVNENRATSLQEAFNLLEKQHFYEDQKSAQEEIVSLQQDIAASSRWNAAASTVTAFSTARINSKIRK